MASPITVESITWSAGRGERPAPPSDLHPGPADPTPGDLLALVARAARDALGVARCAVHLLRPGSRLQRVASATAPGVDAPGARIRPLDDAPLAREAVRTGRPAREVTSELVVVRPVHPVLAVPLVVGGEVLGVFEVEQARGGSCDERSVAGFAALAEAALARAAAPARPPRPGDRRRRRPAR